VSDGPEIFFERKMISAKQSFMGQIFHERVYTMAATIGSFTFSELELKK
jgi:hypothetical protein